MQDTIIKGTGNSRSIKSVPNFLTLYPTYEAFAAALVGGTLPIDLGPLSAAGVQQMGTALSKANLLTDAVEQALWGSAGNRTPNQALEKLRTLIQAAQSTANGRATLAKGTYVGTGKAGAANANILNFAFDPYVLLVAGKTMNHMAFFVRPAVWATLIFAGWGFSNPTNNITNVVWNSKSVKWYCVEDKYHNASTQMNSQDTTYCYVAMG